MTNGAPGICVPANACGNGVLEAGEGCDTGVGNGTPGNKCAADCKITNGNPCNATAPGATGNASCESGLCNTSGGAPGVCASTNTCGNGVLETGEGCDDGANNGMNADPCDATCKIVDGQPCNATAPGAMGNASCESGICDTQGTTAPGVCASPNTCGNGVLEAGEGCDHGANNGKSGDSCDATCKIVNNQPCNATAPGATGNASCESGLCNTSGGAPGTCVATNTCGNGVLEAGEGCDDGANNGKPSDKCDSKCKIVDGKPCNAMAPGSTGNMSCESGVCNTAPGAPGICVMANVCGNGVLEAGEGCDDGNTTAGDGCDAMCKIENGKPCNATAPGATGSASCESGQCNLTGGAPGTCVPMGCSTDSDCTGGNWCNESTRVCTPKVTNGMPVPTDPPHMNPSLTGLCTDAAAMLTCQSGVCDPSDNECGYGNGDGSCTPSNAPVVCRSGICGDDGKCSAGGSKGFSGGGFCSMTGAGTRDPRGGGWIVLMLLAAIAVLTRRARSREI